MKLFQYIIVPFLVIIPALITYSILLKFIPLSRISLAIISGLLGGIVYGELFAGAMHLNNAFISISYFGMIGTFIFFGLAELKNKKRLVRLKENIGFLLAGLIIQYLIFFDIKGIAFSLNLDFMTDYWLVWLLNLIFIVVTGFVVRKLLMFFIRNSNI